MACRKEMTITETEMGFFSAIVKGLNFYLIKDWEQIANRENFNPINRPSASCLVEEKKGSSIVMCA